MHYEIARYEAIEYMIRYPNGYEPGQRCPVILHLHGAGTIGQRVEQLREQYCFQVTETMENFPFIVVCPLCHDRTWFDIFEQLKRFAIYLSQAEFCQSDRFYLIGGSMGAYTAWQLGMSLPELFAAMVPICGGGMYWNAARLKDMPVWAFHGAKDPTVLCRESELMVRYINQKGGNARLTVYPNNRHDAWSDTYRNPAVYEWLLSHKKYTAAATEDTYSNNPKHLG